MPSFFMPRNTPLLAAALLAGTALADSTDFNGNNHGHFGLTGCQHGESLGQCWNRTGQRLSDNEADKARDRANGLEKSATQRAELADQIEADRNSLGSRLNESPTRETRNNILNQAYSPQAPADASQSSRSMEESMRKLGLNSQRDLWEKGPEAQRTLIEDAKKEAIEAGDLFRAANQGSQAATKLGQMAEISRQRQEGIKSIAAAGTAVSAKAGKGGIEGPSSAAASPGSSSPSSGLRAAELTKGASGKTMDWQGEAGAKAGAAAAFRKEPSLREKLKAALAAAKARGDTKESARLSGELANVEMSQVKGEASRAPASEGAGSGTLAGSPAGFSMGVDDAQSVRAAVEAFERTLAEGSAAAEDPRSLFQRVTSSLRGSLAAGRIR